MWGVQVPESANSPARFALLESKKKSPFQEIVAKNAFQVRKLADLAFSSSELITVD